MSSKEEKQLASLLNDVSKRHAVINPNVITTDTPTQREKLFNDRFINGEIAFSDFMRSAPLENVDEEDTLLCKDYFVSSALDPQSEYIYYMQLISSLTKNPEALILPQSILKDTNLTKLDNFTDIRGSAKKNIAKLDLNDSSEWSDISAIHLHDAYKEKFTNAEEEYIKFATNSYFTRNFSGFPYTHIFTKCYMATTLEPGTFDENYEQLEKEFKQFHIENYPTKKMLKSLIDKRLEALKVNFSAIGDNKPVEP